MNKTRIRIVEIQDFGRNQKLYCQSVCGLRYATKVGDTEVVNNTVLGKLARADVKFKKVV